MGDNTLTKTFQYIEYERHSGIYSELELLTKEIENEIINVFHNGQEVSKGSYTDDMMYLKGIKKCLELVDRDRENAYDRMKLFELGKEKEDVFEYLTKYQSKEEPDWVEPPMPTPDDYLAMYGDNKNG